MVASKHSESGTWDRVVRGLPVLVAGDGLGLWQSTHRDDCGLLFAHAALSRKTYGQTYNATRDETMTWRDYYRVVARALDTRAKVIFVPARADVAFERLVERALKLGFEVENA